MTKNSGDATKKFKDRRRPCKKCNGTGLVSSVYASDYPDISNSVEIVLSDCPFCSGKGIVLERVKKK
jgi:DnaJ-class molecular chaperone